MVEQIIFWLVAAVIAAVLVWFVSLSWRTWYYDNTSQFPLRAVLTTALAAAVLLIIGTVQHTYNTDTAVYKADNTQRVFENAYQEAQQSITPNTPADLQHMRAEAEARAKREEQERMKLKSEQAFDGVEAFRSNFDKLDAGASQ